MERRQGPLNQKKEKMMQSDWPMGLGLFLAFALPVGAALLVRFLG